MAQCCHPYVLSLERINKLIDHKEFRALKRTENIIL